MKLQLFLATAAVALTAAAASGQTNLIGNGTFDDPLIPGGPSSPGDWTIFQGDFGGGNAALNALISGQSSSLTLSVADGEDAFIGVQQQVLGLAPGDRLDLRFDLLTIDLAFTCAFEFRLELIDATGSPIDLDNDGAITFGPGDILAFNNTLTRDPQSGDLLLVAADEQNFGTAGVVSVSELSSLPGVFAQNLVRIEGFEIPAGIGAGGVNVVVAVQSFFVQPTAPAIEQDLDIDNVRVEFSPPAPVATIDEDFNSGLPSGNNSAAAAGVSFDLPSGTWHTINESDNVGQVAQIFGSSESGPPAPFEGADAALTRAAGVTVGGDLDIYLMTPEVELVPGSMLTFRTASADGFPTPNRLRVRLSTSGPSVDTADFDEVLLTINEPLAPDGFPTSYALVSVPVPDLPAGSTGRFAFHVDQPIVPFNAAPLAIDTVTYAPPLGLAELDEAFNSGLPFASMPVDGAPPGLFFGLESGSWFVLNESVPLGQRSVSNGQLFQFDAFSGAANSYAAMTFGSTSDVGKIDVFFMSPVLDLRDGASFSFWTRTEDGSPFADRLRVLLSTSGTSTDVANFDTELVTINESLAVPGYPEDWQRVEVTLSGIGSGTPGRIAFHYDVPNGGLNGTNSNYVGIDSVRYGDPITLTCDDVDRNNDGVVNAFDLLLVLADFDAEELSVDFNEDTVLTPEDLVLAITAIGVHCP